MVGERVKHSGRGPLYGVLAADGVSRVGNVLTVTAIPWFVLVTTGSATRTGVTVFVGAVAVVISLFFGGVVVDRFSYRRVSILGDLFSGISVALIPLLHHTVGLEFWQLLVLVFTGTLLDIPAQVARYSALPDLASAAGMRFERANSISDSLITAGSLAGPAAAGLLIASVGASNVLLFDAATFGLSILLMAGFVPSVPAPVREPGSRYLAELLDGLRFVRNEPLLFPLILFFAAMNVLIGPVDVVFLPVYASEVFDSSIAFGVMMAAMAGGSLAGNLIFGWIGHRLPRRAVFFAGFVCVPLGLGLLALEPGFLPVVAILVGLGLGLNLANLLEYTIYFERIPGNMRARVLGITGAIGWVSVPIGRLLGGLLIDWLGLSAALATIALVFLPLPFLLLVLRPFQDMRSPADAEARTEVAV